MATWKKVLVSGSAAEVSSLKLSGAVNAGTDTDKFLVLDGSGNVDFRTGAQVLSDIGAGTGGGDITAVVAGTGLTGGATAGSATLNVSGLTTSEIAAGTLITAAEDFEDNDDTKIATVRAIVGQGYTTNVGDITAVTAGTGLTGGGSSGGVTLNVIGGDGITANANEVEVTVDGTTIELSGTNGSGAVRAKTAAIAESGTALATADQIYTFVTDFGYTTNVGDITGVTAGTGLSGGGSSGAVTLNVDLSELTDMTQAINSSQDELILLDNGADRRKLISEIPLSAFNNDSGFTSNNGDITGVTAGTGLSGGGSSGAVTLNVGDLTVSEISEATLITASEDFEDTDDTKIATVRAILGQNYTTNVGDITNVTAGTGLSGGGSSGAVTLAFDGTELQNHTIGNGNGTITIDGNLTVSGTTTTVNTTNLDVTDTFISLNNGGSAADSGIVVEGQGAAFAWDESENRWGYDFSGADGSNNSVTFDAYAVTVESGAETITGVSGNYTKNGNMYIDTSNGDIFIYS